MSCSSTLSSPSDEGESRSHFLFLGFVCEREDGEGKDDGVHPRFLSFVCSACPWAVLVDLLRR